MDSVRVILDDVMALWQPRQVPSKILQLSEVFIDHWLSTFKGYIDLRDTDLPVSNLMKLI